MTNELRIAHCPLNWSLPIAHCPLPIAHCPLPFAHNTLKIDRSFISGLGPTGQQPAIVESIIGLARSVGASVIAEGVETRGQLRKLKHLGCGYAQGVLFSEALAPGAAEALIARGPVLAAHLLGTLATRRLANVH